MRRLNLAVILVLLLSLPAQAASLGEITQLYKKGKKEQALSELDSYLTALPEDTWGRNVTQARLLRGVILAELGQPDRAIQIFTRLTLDYPELPEAYNNLALVYAGQGNLDAARDTLERGMQIDPAYAAMQANLSEVYTRLSGRAYESTLQASSGKSAPVLVKELCDNYGNLARQSAGRNPVNSGRQDMVSLLDIESGRIAASRPPAHVDIDEMALPAPATTPRQHATGTAKSEPAAKTDTATGSAAGDKDASKQTTPTGSAEDRKKIGDTLEAWAAAWSARKTNTYLDFYAPGFRPPDGASRSAWAAQRRERLTKPKSIRVGVSSLQVSMIDDRSARVSFRQSYRSDTLQTSGSKTLIMVRSGKRWLIQEERMGG